MREKSIADSKLTIREVIYVISAISGFFIQYYSLKEEIRKAIDAQASDKQMFDYRLTALERQAPIKNYNYCPPPKDAILSKETGIEDEKQN